jgi:hypothetical protein
MGTHLIDAVEAMAQDAALAATRARARKIELASVCRQWRDIRGLVPQEPRHDAVNDAMEQAEFFGPTHARPLYEAIARYALWFEGYSFAR